ncbi:putative nucleoside-diphosphate-sugar epimerase [Hoeflea phototrophica DFL-43]|uniref:Divinyl chlorophyllide a 8-vinyl-reductase, chloroplastic n=1 Tax=Hoeflea phototrophica (strain DSM 17068 / NCIMB 14078 / DFL-43) TaxID=411684 RepID=A9D501_HOEPD|nr:NAD(P)H-binding protein [Hoeflea phototrophica]EDQ34001.1 putative nucleoside-diphosphate-sugar epimerase [Hoeflea phototrophica DFL-43]
MSKSAADAPRGHRVLVLGGTGTIGRATVRALVDQGHEVVCFVRGKPGGEPAPAQSARGDWPVGVSVRHGDITDPLSFARDGICGETFDALVSCLASRTGAPKDAWAIDCQAHSKALKVATEAGIGQMVLLSAICVQKPLLEFQKAKLAFEAELMASGLTYSIVRPTAFFKSLSGQIERVRKGKPFLLFGDGELTACKPISDRDLGQFIATCLKDESRWNRILPVGGPGPAITPREQGDKLFALLGKEPKFKHVPVAMMDVIIKLLSVAGHVSPRLADKAELARIGRYYATESMLVLDPATNRYDADATPSFGSDTLFDYYEQMLRGGASVERGDHAVF